MATILFLSLPLAGHINPSLSLVKELTGRGHAVIYYATDEFAVAVQQAGARHQRYRSAFLSNMRIADRLHELSLLLMRATVDLLREHLGEFRGHNADFVITDSVAPWGQWLARILDVPVVTSVSTFAFNRQVLRFAAAHGVRPKSARLLFLKLIDIAKALWLGRKLRRRYRVRGPGIASLLLGRSRLNIVYTSRYFQPCAETFDDRFVFAGPSLTSRRETPDFPWNKVPGSVLLYVSLGTLFNAGVDFYRHCFEAFQGEDVQVILSTGKQVSQESLGEVPRNFLVQAHVPQLAVLARAAAFVTHGGMNSVSESLCYGVPVLVIPQMSEQALVGRRVEQLGAGLYLAKAEVTASKLRALAGRLLSEPQFRGAAAVIGESFRNACGPARAADAIEAYSKQAREQRRSLVPRAEQNGIGFE